MYLESSEAVLSISSSSFSYPESCCCIGVSEAEGDYKGSQLTLDPGVSCTAATSGESNDVPDLEGVGVAGGVDAWSKVESSRLNNDATLVRSSSLSWVESCCIRTRSGRVRLILR